MVTMATKEKFVRIYSKFGTYDHLSNLLTFGIGIWYLVFRLAICSVGIGLVSHTNEKSQIISVREKDIA